VLFNDFINIITGGNCNFSRVRGFVSSLILLEGDQSRNVSPIVMLFKQHHMQSYSFNIANSYR